MIAQSAFADETDPMLWSATGPAGRADDPASYNEVISPSRGAYNHTVGGSSISMREGRATAGPSFANPREITSWVSELCNAPPVAPGQIENHTSFGAGATVRTARNALGTLELLLENYEKDLTYVRACREARKRVPSACRLGGTGPKPARTIVEEPPPGQRTDVDLLAVHDAAVNGELTVLEKSFGEMKEIHQLGGSEASIEMARKIRHAVDAASTCGMRAIASSYERR